MSLQLQLDPVHQNGTVTIDMVWALPPLMTTGPSPRLADPDEVAIQAACLAYPADSVTLVPLTEAAVYDAALARMEAVVVVTSIDRASMSVTYEASVGRTCTVHLRVVRVCLREDALPALPSAGALFAQSTTLMKPWEDV